ncbi:MAG: efflux RND transporter periplasmic adaptor subunit [Planctomycetes bacterium]|nr:efflux RND transporter periplasmic adaptor subunit [Planctomycetota bacterium]
MKKLKVPLKALRWVLLLGLCAAVVLYAAGFFGGERVKPGEEPPSRGLPTPSATATAEKLRAPLYEDAVGTVESRRTIAVAAQVVARVVAVTRRAGESVKAGEELVVLDDREFRARLAQSNEAKAAAEAATQRAEQAKLQAEARLTRATSEETRVQALAKERAATTQQLEAAQADLADAKAAVAGAEAAILAARAQVAHSAQVVAEAEIALTHTKIVAPLDGVVSERAIEPGDLASPGRTLLVVLDPHALRLTAQVRERSIGFVRAGATFDVELPALGAKLAGTVAEILPSADPASRSFAVRIDLPANSNARPGMFGRMKLVIGERELVGAPRRAIARVGQLETVVVQRDARWERRLVTTGSALDADRVEVLSGLDGGELLGLGVAP